MSNYLEFQMDVCEQQGQSHSHNPFTGRKLPSGFDREQMPWLLPRKVALGTSGPVGHFEAKEHYKKYVKHFRTKVMGHELERDTHLDDDSD